MSGACTRDCHVLIKLSLQVLAVFIIRVTETESKTGKCQMHQDFPRWSSVPLGTLSLKGREKMSLFLGTRNRPIFMQILAWRVSLQSFITKVKISNLSMFFAFIPLSSFLCDQMPNSLGNMST